MILKVNNGSYSAGTVVGVLFGVTSYGVYQAIEHKKLLM